MKDCWVTSNKLRNGSAGWPLRPGKVAVLTAHQWPLPRALCSLRSGIDVGAQKQKFPAVLLLLPLNHPVHLFIVIAFAGIFVSVGNDDKHRLIWYIFLPSVLRVY